MIQSFSAVALGWVNDLNLFMNIVSCLKFVTIYFQTFQDSYMLSKSLTSSPTISTTITKPVTNPKTQADIQESNDYQVNNCRSVQHTKLATCQGKHLLSETELKLKNEREELEIQRRSIPADYSSPQRIIASTPFSKGSQKRISSSALTNISAIQYRKENPLVIQDVSRMFASAEGKYIYFCAKSIIFISDLEGSNLSVANTHQSLQSSNPSLVSSSPQPSSKILITSTPQTQEHLVSSSQEFSQSRTLIPKSNSIVEEENYSSRSNIVPEATIIQKQVLLNYKH